MYNVGGINGHANLESSIENCSNTGSIVGTDYVGGIAGCATSVVTKCYNSGSISSSGNNGVGGIVGDSVTGCGQDISFCYNSGTIIGNGQVGGINGYLGSEGADPTGQLKQCYNRGKIVYNGTGDTYGGIVGKMASDANVLNSYYLSNVGADKGIGAIATGGDLEAQNANAIATEVDLKTYQEFLEWIKQYE